MRVKLKVMHGKNSGKSISISSTRFIIGRDDTCELRPKSDTISRRHCELRIKGGRVLVRDLKSKNGTFVNEEPVGLERVQVQDGDILRVGRLEFGVAISSSRSGKSKVVSKSKSPEVAAVGGESTKGGVGNSAVPTVSKAESNGSSVNDMEISDWLGEGDDTDELRKLAGPDTRHFVLQEEEIALLKDGTKADADDETGNSSESTAESTDDAKTKGKKQKPGKLPAKMLEQSTDSREAATDMLKRFFNRR